MLGYSCQKNRDLTLLLLPTTCVNYRKITYFELSLYLSELSLYLFTEMSTLYCPFCIQYFKSL